MEVKTRVDGERIVEEDAAMEAIFGRLSSSSFSSFPLSLFSFELWLESRKKEFMVRSG